MPNPLLWVAVYLGIAASAILRRWRQAHPPRPDYGNAGDVENPDQVDAYREWRAIL